MVSNAVSESRSPRELTEGIATTPRAAQSTAVFLLMGTQPSLLNDLDIIFYDQPLSMPAQALASSSTFERIKANTAPSFNQNRAPARESGIEGAAVTEMPRTPVAVNRPADSVNRQPEPSPTVWYETAVNTLATALAGTITSAPSIKLDSTTAWTEVESGSESELMLLRW